MGAADSGQAGEMRAEAGEASRATIRSLVIAVDNGEARSIDDITTERACREADRILLSRYAPAGVVIREDQQIVQFRGRTGGYLAPAPGAPRCDLLEMARAEIVPELGAALHKAQRVGEAVRVGPVQVSDAGPGRTRAAILEVIPLGQDPHDRHAAGGDGARGRHYLVVFEEQPALAPDPGGHRPEAGDPGAAPAPAMLTESRQILQLRHELRDTREHLLGMVEELTAANEEIQACCEELLASNEELNAINDEIDLDRECLRSRVEDLSRAHAKLCEQNAELLRRAVACGEHLLETAREPLAVLDGALRVVRVNAPFCRLLRQSRESIEGRSIYDACGGRRRSEGLRALLEQALSDASTHVDQRIEIDVPGLGRRVLLANARLVRQEAPPAERIVLAMEDVTGRLSLQPATALG